MSSLQETNQNLYNVSKEILDQCIAEKSVRDVQVRQAISSMQNTMLRPKIGYYDGQAVSKLTLGIAASTVDHAVSEWYPVPNTKSNHFFLSEGKLTLVDLIYAYSYDPGYPAFTTSDKSSSFAQFVYAPDSITSDGINARLAAIGQNPELAGGWWDCTSTVKAVAVYQPDLNMYSRLFVRFVNRSAYYLANKGEYVPQDIVTYGGAVPFRVAQVRHYSALEG